MLAGSHPRSLLLPRASALGSGRRRLPVALSMPDEIAAGPTYDCGNQARLTLPLERLLAGEHLVEDNAKGKDVST